MRECAQAGIDLIKTFEGFRASAYLCPANVWTIGYGHTKNVNPGDHITEEVAEKYLKDDLHDVEQAISDLVHVALCDMEHAALCSLVFNIGIKAFKNSTILKKINGRLDKEVPDQFRRWNKAAGKVLKGLTARREAEVQLWLA